MKPETMKKFLTPGAVWVKDDGERYVVTIEGDAPWAEMVEVNSGFEARVTRDNLPKYKPDGTHPATLGVALDIARRAWNAPEVCTAKNRPLEWRVHPYAMNGLCGSESSPAQLGNGGETEFDALISAIEAAPAAGGAG